MSDPRDSELFGVFKEEKSLAGGATYTHGKDGATPVRWRGKQLATGGTVSGKAQDAWLDKNLKLTTAGDMYQDPAALQRMLEKKSGVPVSQSPFKPSHVGQAMGRTSGALYGTFGPAKMLLDTDASLGRNSGKANLSAADKKRNIYVNVPKKGGFGFPDQSRLMGETKYTYYPDTYCRARELEKEIRAEARKQVTRPFISSAKTRPTFASDNELFAKAPNPEQGKGRLNTARSASAGSNRPIWRPSNPPAKGPGHGTITKIPYVPDPIREAQFRANEKGAVKPFKPVGGIHKRLSMWAPNHYALDARPPPDNDLSLL